ncbi:His Kinase A (phospho-acceptor) domain-containing protein [Nonomuraea maritima]|uniref:Signal transduction histidine-protein kinase/phosphatase MprB n=1 Tax=Nonomuraea maritima TaxID=683260 RepID=A0A1G8YXV2_9ACTN|nr:DUF4153 domain-containing protein [Nonomuraea maritima]SDK06885.1 His Kinase A (phospho-acceptor) domain-containing protein [Nonomuraea maritima]
MRPLDFLGRIKVKLGIVIVLAVATAFAVNELGLSSGLSRELRIAVAVVLALIMVQVLARGMTKPLRELARAAQTIAKGRYSLRVRATSRDEVGELARAFNAMAADLGEVDRQRRELIANVSHELRTPITGLRAVLENVVDGVSAPDPVTMRTALAQTERLGRLVAQLLDLSRLDSGVRLIEAEAVEPARLVEQAVLEASLARDDVVIRASVPGDLVVRADPDLLAQVLANLLDNAVRHSPSGGVVTVSGEPERDGVRIVVADQGPGIPAAARARVFERFSRLDAGRAADSGGAGLGLAIVKEIVELHGGTVHIDDGTGCRMVVTLPGRTELPADAGPAAAETSSPGPSGAGTTPAAVAVLTTTAGSAVGEKPAAGGPARTSAAAPPSRAAAHGVDPAIGGGGASQGSKAAGRGETSEYVPPPLFPRPVVPATPGWVLPVAAAVGVFAALVLPDAEIGLGFVLVVTAIAAAALFAVRWRMTPWTAAFALIAYVMISMAAVRDADWLVAILLLAGAALGALAVSGAGAGWLGVLKGVASVALALGPVPWFLAGPLKRLTSRRRVWAVVATLGLTGVLLAVFGLLFASADAVFASYVTWLTTTPEWAESLPGRFILFGVFAVLPATVVLVGLRPVAEPVGQVTKLVVARGVWLVPLTAVNLLFAAFVAVQITALFGGDALVLRTAGLTYAEYARQGFFQLVVVSVFVLGVVAVAAGLLRVERRERRVLYVLLGVLCGLTMVVLVSALHRLHLYTDAYGLSRLRLSVEAAVWWLGALFVLVLVAGAARLAGRGSGWLPRTAVLVTGLGLVAFAVANPDLRVARSQIETRGVARMDAVYLSSLSADAVPALDRLPEPRRSCVLSRLLQVNHLLETDPWNGWNLARAQATALPAERPVDKAGRCPPAGSD